MPIAKPHTHLIVLRSTATLVLGCLVGQAGWAAALLGGDEHFRRFHEVGGFVTLGVTVASALTYLVLRRSAGPVNVSLAGAVALASAVQIGLAESHLVAPHIFVGVLTVALGTALTSWTYRHRFPVAAA